MNDSRQGSQFLYEYLTVFCDVTSCDLVNMYNRFEGHLPPSSTLQMEVAGTSETFVNVYQITRCHIPIFYVSDTTHDGNCKNILSDGASGTVWTRPNHLDLYSGGARFETRPGHWVSWLRFFVVLISHSRKNVRWYFEYVTINRTSRVESSRAEPSRAEPSRAESSRSH
jgi:hypothetical protein